MIGAIIAIAGVAITLVTAFVANCLKRIKARCQGVKYRRGELIIEDGTGTAKIYNPDLHFVLWPRDEMVVVELTNRTARITFEYDEIAHFTMGGIAHIRKEQRRVALDVIWRVRKSYPWGPNYVERAAVNGQTGLDALAATIFAGGAGTVHRSKGLTLDELLDPGEVTGWMKAVCSAELEKEYGGEIHTVKLVENTRTAIQVLVDNGRDEVKALNGHTIPALEAAGVQLPITV